MRITPRRLIVTAFFAIAVLVFGAAWPVGEFNCFESDQLTDLSADGLTATLQSNREMSRVRIYSSKHATLSSPWSTPSNTDFAATNSFTNVGTPSSPQTALN